MLHSLLHTGVVSFPDPTSREEKGLVNLGRILGVRSTARADPAMQSLDLIGLYGRTGDWRLSKARIWLVSMVACAIWLVQQV